MNWKSLLSILFVASLLGDDANARPPLDSLNRIHVGLSMTDSVGVGLGFDSRMTNIIYMDVGSFMSTGEAKAESTIPDETGENTWLLRHGLYLAPGLRFPHKQPEKIQWDIFVRGGFSGVWAADAASKYDQVSNMALFTGGEFMLKSGNIGMRLSGKVFYYKPYSKYLRAELTLLQPQYGAEAVYQF